MFACVLCEFVLFWHLWTQPPQQKRSACARRYTSKDLGTWTNHSLKHCGKSAPHLPPRNKTGRARPHSTLKVPRGHHFVKVVWLCAPWEFGNLGNPWKASLELNGFLTEFNIDEHCTSRTGSHGSAIQHCYKVHCKYTAHLHRSYHVSESMPYWSSLPFSPPWVAQNWALMTGCTECQEE